MLTKRIIPCLDVDAGRVVKGTSFVDLRDAGDPAELAALYDREGGDELVFLDITASSDSRDTMVDVVRRVSEQVFIPLTVGGGIRSLDDAREMLRSGADKVAINTAATKRPELITEMSRRFGTQCMVLSIEAMRKGEKRWEAYTDNGREPTGLDVVEWARKGAALGAGEILLTSVDREGRRQGFDVELVRAVAGAVPIPVIASGGMGCLDHLVAVVEQGGASAVAMADVLHYGRIDLRDIRAHARHNGIGVRHQ